MSVQSLTAHEATVSTGTVEIKTLTIGRKQVTLAVFRQIVEESLIDEREPSLLGVPWGQVNYHPDKCSDEAEHIHVVWQKDDELRRARVRFGDPNWVNDDDWDLQKLGKLAVFRDIDETGILSVENTPGPYLGLRKLIRSSRGYFVTADLLDVAAAQTLERSRRALDSEPAYYSLDGQAHRDHASARRAALEIGHRFLDLPEGAEDANVEELWALYGQWRESRTRRLARHHRIVSELCLLPQLFIAV